MTSQNLVKIAELSVLLGSLLGLSACVHTPAPDAPNTEPKAAWVTDVTLHLPPPHLKPPRVAQASR